MTESYDAIVVGGGVIGAATAFNLKKLGCDRVMLMERDQTGMGGTAKSSAIVRTHYSIPTNTQLAVQSLDIFANFKETLGHDEADCGWVNSGYMILAPEGPTADSLTANLGMQAALGAETRLIDRDEARALHPLLNLDDIAAIGYEPHSGYAKPGETTYSYVRAALDLGIELKRSRAALGLMRDGDRVVGVETYAENFPAKKVICTMGPWSGRLAEWTGLDIPLEISRHTVLTLMGEERCAVDAPIVTDLAAGNKIYFRPTSNGAVLVGTGDHGEPIASVDDLAAPVGMDVVTDLGTQMAHRMPSFADCAFTGTWNGAYDITPDWNPVLGAVPERDGLIIAYGFSGHGFGLAPAVGKVLAQTALGRATDVDLSPYALSRFATGTLLSGAYGIGSMS